MSYKSLCVVITDWGDLRDQIFSRTGFAPSAYGWLALGRSDTGVLVLTERF